jgi:hypothetical protein
MTLGFKLSLHSASLWAKAVVEYKPPLQGALMMCVPAIRVMHQIKKLFTFCNPSSIGLIVLKSRSLKFTIRMEANCIPLPIKIIIPLR